MSNTSSNTMEVFSSPMKWRCCLFAAIAYTCTCYILAKMSEGVISECSADVLYYQQNSDNVINIKNNMLSDMQFAPIKFN